MATQSRFYISDLLHKIPKSFDKLRFVIAMVTSAFERRIVDQKPDQFVPDVRNRIGFYQVEKVIKVRPRSFHPNKVHQAFQG